MAAQTKHALPDRLAYFDGYEFAPISDGRIAAGRLDMALGALATHWTAVVAGVAAVGGFCGFFL